MVTTRSSAKKAAKPSGDLYSVLLPTYEEYDNIGIIVWLIVKLIRWAWEKARAARTTPTPPAAAPTATSRGGGSRLRFDVPKEKVKPVLTGFRGET